MTKGKKKTAVPKPDRHDLTFAHIKREIDYIRESISIAHTKLRKAEDSYPHAITRTLAYLTSKIEEQGRIIENLTGDLESLQAKFDLLPVITPPPPERYVFREFPKMVHGKQVDNRLAEWKVRMRYRLGMLP